MGALEFTLLPDIPNFGIQSFVAYGVLTRLTGYPANFSARSKLIRIAFLTLSDSPATALN